MCCRFSLRYVLLFASFLLSSAVAQQVAPSDGVGATFTTPVSTVTLQVLVTDSAGQPQPGASVLFVAPPSGPGGEFTPGTGDTQTRAATGDDGIATAQFYTNSLSGPYMVSAWVEGTSAMTHLAITNTTLPPPALDARTALQAVRDQLQPAAGAFVYGPFLLDPGTAITPSVNVPAVQPVNVTAPSLFIWIDDNPAATYDHSVRWVLLDASTSTPAVQPIGRNWAPYVVPSGSASGYGLVAPLYRLDASAIIAPPAAAVLPGTLPRAVVRPLGDGSNTDACAIVVYGPDAEAFADGAAKMRDVFSDTLNIPDANIFEDTTPGTLFGVNHRPSTPSRLRDLFAKARAKGCKKIYYYFAGHGYDGGFCLAKEPGSKSDGDYDCMSFTELATQFESTKAMQVFVVQQSCHSASAIAPLQGHGFDGEIVTAADLNGLAYHNFVPGFRECFWTSALAKSWKASGATTDLKILGESLVSALKLQNDVIYNTYVLPGNPRSGTIEAKGGQAAAPAEIVIVNLDDTTLNPVTFTVNKPANFTPGDGTVEMFIDDIGVAKDPASGGSEADQHNSNVTLKPDTANATFTVRGLKEGSTPYRITFKDRDQKTYTATGVILVGKGYDIAPNPVQVQAGGTATVKVTRGTALAKQSGSVKLTIRTADAASADVAAPGATEVTFPPGATSVDVPIRGLKAGTATFQISDGKITKSFQASVTASTSACPPGAGSLRLNIQLVSDPFDSARFVLMPATANLQFNIGNGTLGLTSAVAQLPSGSGALNASTCTSSIKTIASMPVAGFRNVKVEYDVSFDGGGTSVSMVIREGTENTLNNEPQPVTYRATGTVTR